MKRILVALDTSNRAPLVLAAAATLAGTMNATLVVFRAVGIPPDLPHEIFDHTDVSLEELLLRNGRVSLELLLNQVDRARVEKVVTEVASPWDGICRAARTYEADLIVLGSHGYGGLDRVLGTTASKVVNHADRNVLVVRTEL